MNSATNMSRSKLKARILIAFLRVVATLIHSAYWHNPQPAEMSQKPSRPVSQPTGSFATNKLADHSGANLAILLEHSMKVCDHHHNISFIECCCLLVQIYHVFLIWPRYSQTNSLCLVSMYGFTQLSHEIKQLSLSFAEAH